MSGRKHFLRQDCTKEGLEYKELSAEAMSLLLNSNWQGNIRELKNVIDRSIVQTASNAIIKEKDIKRAFQAKAIIKEKTLRGATTKFEKKFLINNLLLNDWNVAQTADKIGIDSSNLHKKIKHYKIKRGKQ